MEYSKTIEQITAPIEILKIVGSNQVLISQITSDSRKVGANAMFVAVKGTQVDGHQYIESCVKAGAVAIVCQEIPKQISSNVTYIQVADGALALGLLAHSFYQYPSHDIKLVGVTGTNGKTTIATLLYQLTEQLGYKAGLISTVENYIHTTRINATHTTPDPVQLNRLLADMVEAGCDFCFMEVSSHAVAQHRIAGLRFEGGLFTNLTHDHLDYHGTFAEYLKAKKAFFDQLEPSAFAITNIDDKNGAIMLQNCSARQRSYSVLQMADYKSKVLDYQFDATHVLYNGMDFWYRLIGKFNVYNMTAILATAQELGFDTLEVLEKAGLLESVNGRFQSLRSQSGITAIVDYAHTPDALLNVIETINQLKENAQLITVVGAGGDRDASKRPIMAKIAATHSQKVILTSDNPRSEDPEKILDDMEVGLDPVDKKRVLRISDRRQAIQTAYMLAQKGDIILVAGKGHETYQEIKGIRHHFDDKEELRKIMN